MRHAVVTGGTKGIGKEICRKLLKDGFSVISVYKEDEQTALSTKNEFESDYADSFHLIKCDLSDTKNIPVLFAEVTLITESVEVLILNAGKTVRKGITDITPDEWVSVIDTNITVPLFLIQKFLPLLKNGSNIIFTGSSMAIMPHSVSLSYGISKSAVHSMTKNLVKFLAPFGIRVNCVAPGFVDTSWHENKSKEIRENISKKLSLGRFARPEEIASAFMFIIHNHYLNGEILTIDGGYSYQ
jgi:3-oxoacyl-[acyl-carrier protein] reductase